MPPTFQSPALAAALVATISVATTPLTLPSHLSQTPLLTSLYIIKWDYDKRICDIYMPTYIEEALHKFQHPAPSLPQDAPHAWNQPVYGAAVQYADQPDDFPLLPPKSINLVQQIIGTLLYYAIAVDPTMLVDIGAMTSQQSKSTQATRDATVWLLNYAAYHPNATI